MNDTTQAPNIVALHDQPVTIEPNNFRYKSLSTWCCNTFLGCLHACPICFAPETSANRQKRLLVSFGILDPVLDWGRYLLLRPLDRQKFLTSLRKAVRTHPGLRKRDGNDVIMFCSTTDAYQVIHHPDPEVQRRFQRMAKSSRRWMLETIRDHSALNVRILTRSPLAREDFDIFQSFGDRLLLGTSLPTLDQTISSIYEPRVSAPRHRLKLLTDAHEAGIHTYVAVAPVYPEVGYDGMLEVFRAVKQANPHTVFVEPVNLKLEIAERVSREALRQGHDIDLTPYSDSSVSSSGASWSGSRACRARNNATMSSTVVGVFFFEPRWKSQDFEKEPSRASGFGCRPASNRRKLVGRISTEPSLCVPHHQAPRPEHQIQESRLSRLGRLSLWQPPSAPGQSGRRAWASGREMPVISWYSGVAIKAWPEIRREILEEDKLERLFWSDYGE